MDCELLQDEVCAYADNELDDETRETVAAHVAHCELCEAELADMRAMKAMVGRLRLQDLDPPASLTIFPEVEAAPEPMTTVAFWRRPLSGRYIGLAAAAVFVGLMVGWRFTVGQYGDHARTADIALAHSSGVTQALKSGPPPRTVGLGDTGSVIWRQTWAQVGNQRVRQTIYNVGEHIVSQFDFEPGQFDDGHLPRMSLGPHSYRVDATREFSVVSRDGGSTQTVLVATCPPEVLVGLAQKIPSDDIGGVGY